MLFAPGTLVAMQGFWQCVERFKVVDFLLPFELSCAVNV